MVPNNNQQYGPTDQTGFSMEMGNKKHGFRMILITVIVIIIAIVGYFLAKKDNFQQVLKNAIPGTGNTTEETTPSAFTAPAVSTITNRTIPWLEITSENGTTFTQGQPVTLTISASSGGNDIAGYDLLLAIDPTLFEVQSITSELPYFGISRTDRPTHISLTSIKDLGQNDATILDNTPILKVTAKPLKKGSTIISIFVDQGKERSQLVNTGVTPIPPQVGSLQVEVK